MLRLVCRVAEGLLLGCVFVGVDNSFVIAFHQCELGKQQHGVVALPGESPGCCFGGMETNVVWGKADVCKGSSPFEPHFGLAQQDVEYRDRRDDIQQNC